MVLLSALLLLLSKKLTSPVFTVQLKKSTREGAVLEFRSRATKAAAAARTATAIGATQSRRRVGADDRIAALTWLGIPWKKEKKTGKFHRAKIGKLEISEEKVLEILSL